jgi:hypothetical protein
MINNALLDKWEEIYGKKKEEPTPIENKIAYELDPEFIEKLKDVNTTLSSGTINTGTGLTASNYMTAIAVMTASNASISYSPKSIKTYDVYSTEDAFKQIADKVKDGTAKVSSMTMEMDMVGSFAAGKRVTFEVYVYE